MSFECYNLINVTGSRTDVRQFRQDARRRLSPRLKAELELSTIELSIEKLFRLHKLPDPLGGLTGDEGYTSRSSIRWRNGADFRRLDILFMSRTMRFMNCFCPSRVAIRHCASSIVR